METIKLRDNSRHHLSHPLPDSLVKLQGKELWQLQQEAEEGLFVVSGPSQDQIETQTIFSLIGDDTLDTYNLMGFLGTEEADVQISSRFFPLSEDSSAETDFFLYYLLEKVCHFNWINLPHRLGKFSVWDLLPFLFPRYLNQAMRQGLYKQYVSRSYNDSRPKGRLDIARQLAHNIPFNGNFCYTTHEYSYDNPLLQLIRHTAEYIKTTPWGNQLLNNSPETIQNIRTLTDATPSYNRTERTRILAQNARSLKMPYFTEYIPLRNLCLRILRHDTVSFGADKHRLCGLLFDGAWLWEEYLNTLLKPLSFTHAENKKRSRGQWLFQERKMICFPDFYKLNEIVLDAKYKNLNRSYTKDSFNKDLYQLITYMHILPAPVGVLACPVQEENTRLETLGSLNGLGGKVYILRLNIPSDATDYASFKAKMIQEEQTFRSLLQTKDSALFSCPTAPAEPL